MENRRAYERNRKRVVSLLPRRSLCHHVRRARSDMWQWQQEEECFLPTYSQFALPLWDDTMGNQTPLRGFGDFNLDELDFGDEVEKGVEEANEASRVKRRRVLNFFSDDDGATIVNEHLSSEVVYSKTVSSDS